MVIHLITFFLLNLVTKQSGKEVRVLSTCKWSDPFFRSECHSTIVKSLKAMGFLPPDQQNVKLDFIFFHLATSNDGLVCEDKPTEKESSKDRKKVEDLRQKSLQYWQHMLPFDECIHHLTAVSCQFSRLKVKICGTKLIDGVTVHTTLKEATIPMEENDGASWAEYLSTIISLVVGINC